jgi:WD40 repeat protein
MEDSPYPGLRRFEETDADRFFGREDDIRALLSRLISYRFIALIGESGCGKSSVVRAGLIPALKIQQLESEMAAWRIAVMQPSEDPIESLVKALCSPEALGDVKNLTTSGVGKTLRSGRLGLVEVAGCSLPEDAKLLVIIDQFEELFRFKHERATQAADADQVGDFVDLLMSAVRQNDVPVYVLLTMRAEYLGDCSTYPDLAAEITDGLYLLGAMTRENLREAITSPLAPDAVISERLVSRLLNDLHGATDPVPSLQHCMSMLWGRRKDKRAIEGTDYPEDGYVRLSIGQHAEEVYDKLGDQQPIAEHVFRTITAINAQNKTIRNPARFSKIVSTGEWPENKVRETIDKFRQEGVSMLTPFPSFEANLADDSLIDITHESLIRQWKRLSDWSADEAERSKPRLWIRDDCQVWQQKKRSRDYLTGGPRLAEMLEWAKKNPGELKEEEKEFLSNCQGKSTDEWIDQYRRLDKQARDWEEHERDPAMLLSDDGLKRAKRWLDESRKEIQAIAPNQLQHDLIEASEDKRVRRLGMKVAGWTIFLFLAAVISVVKFIDYNRQRANRSASQLFYEFAYQNPLQPDTDEEFSIRMIRLADAVDQTEEGKKIIADKIASLRNKFDVELHPDDSSIKELTQPVISEVPVAQCDTSGKLCWKDYGDKGCKSDEGGTDDASDSMGQVSYLAPRYGLLKGSKLLICFDTAPSQVGVASASENLVIFPGQDQLLAISFDEKKYRSVILPSLGEAELRTIAFAPTNLFGYFATLDENGRVKVYDVTGQRVKEIPRINGPFVSLAFFKNPSDGLMLPRIVTKDDAGKIFSWRPFDSQYTKAAFDPVQVHVPGSLLNFVFDRSGKAPRAVIAGRSKSIDGCCEALSSDGFLVHRVGKESKKTSIRLSAGDSVFAAPCGMGVAILADNSLRLRLWVASSGKIFDLDDTVDGTNPKTVSRQITFNRAGNVIASLKGDGKTILVWRSDPTSIAPPVKILSTGQVGKIVLSSDGQSLAYFDFQNSIVHLRDLNGDAEQVLNVSELVKSRNPESDLIFSADDTRLAVISEKADGVIWFVPKSEGGDSANPKGDVKLLPNATKSVAFSAESKICSALGDDGAIGIYECGSAADFRRTLLIDPPAQERQWLDLALSSNGDWLVLAAGDGSMRIYPARSHPAPVEAVNTSDIFTSLGSDAMPKCQEKLDRDACMDETRAQLASAAKKDGDVPGRDDLHARPIEANLVSAGSNAH